MANGGVTTSGSSSSTSNNLPSFFNCFFFSFTCRNGRKQIQAYLFTQHVFPNLQRATKVAKIWKWNNKQRTTWVQRNDKVMVQHMNDNVWTLTLCSTYSFPAWITSKILFFWSWSSKSLYALSTAKRKKQQNDHLKLILMIIYVKDCSLVASGKFYLQKLAAPVLDHPDFCLDGLKWTTADSKKADAMVTQFTLVQEMSCFHLTTDSLCLPL